MTGIDYPLTDWVLVSDTILTDVVRFTIMVEAVMVAALLLRLYLTHRTGGMSFMVGSGAVLTYSAVAWAQPIALAGPNRDLIPLNVLVLVAITLSLAGTLQAMTIHLFKPGPRSTGSRAERVEDEVMRQGQVVDGIDHAVNQRGQTESTIGEDVRSIRHDMDEIMGRHPAEEDGQ
jgi:hypothetical protein